MIVFLVALFQLGTSLNPRREALNFMASLSKHYSLRDPDIIHPEYQHISGEDGTTILGTYEKEVANVKAFTEEDVKVYAYNYKIAAGANIDDKHFWSSQIAQFTKDGLLEVKIYRNNKALGTFVGKADANIEGGYKFYRFYSYLE
ncbi:unnamed protein product [Caenorhabditis angaria]|uniref:Uncharacterized protein n=1 Tax=Caenorhabditis angaria TaxID=860376 RepID=A0A9P1ID01_9PELO|nr:unnamed protein product [Caenorhabditis angaria]